MTGQAELPLRHSAAPEVSIADVERLVKVLSNAGKQLTASEIALQVYGLVTEDNKRKIRAVAAAARPRIVSFPGSPGYKLWEACTIEEINHCIETFNSSGREALKIAVTYSLALHRRYRGGRAGSEALQPASTDNLAGL